MLKDIIKKIDSAIPSLFPVDPSRFNDPVAMQTEWKGIRFGRSSRIYKREDATEIGAFVSVPVWDGIEG